MSTLLSPLPAVAPPPFPRATPPARASTGAGHADAVRADARALLAWTGALLDQHAAAPAMGCLVPGLRAVRDALGPAEWDAFVRDECLAHPVAGRLREDPFIHRTHAKPRGYAGDAAMLDLIYGEGALPAGTTPLGRALYAVNVQADACRSVRERRAILARAIDEAGARAPGAARVLSLACGHLREAQTSAAVRDGAIAAFHAVDQDPLAIARVHREHARLGVTPAVGSVRDVLRGALRHEGLSLAYAAGLYDYLPAPVAARLTRRLFEMLAPGGRLLLANFCPELVDVGVMEAVMDWRLIYRGEDEVAALAVELPDDQVAARRVWRDSVGCVAYLEVVRA